MPSTFANLFRAHSLVASTFAMGLLLSASGTHVALAAPETGVWRVDPVRSAYNSKSATLKILRVKRGARQMTGSAIIISGEGVYRLPGPVTSDMTHLKPVDFAHMARTGEATLIGTNPRSIDHCGLRCLAGQSESVRTVTFRVVRGAEDQLRDMLASDGQNW